MLVVLATITLWRNSYLKSVNGNEVPCQTFILNLYYKLVALRQSQLVNVKNISVLKKRSLLDMFSLFVVFRPLLHDYADCKKN